MILTKEDAEMTWCPFARATISGNAGEFTSANRFEGSGDPFDDCLCVSSRCMAWRYWGRDDKQNELGFCGLAGPAKA